MNKSVCYLILTHVLDNVKLENKKKNSNYFPISYFTDNQNR